MGMAERLVVHPVHGAAWFFSCCSTDALVQAAGKWDECTADILDAYRRREVKVLIRKEDKDNGRRNVC